MDFYGLYPCVVPDAKNVKNVKKSRAKEACSYFLDKLKQHNHEELDGQFFRDIRRFNLGEVVISLDPEIYFPEEQMAERKRETPSQSGFAFFSVHEQTKAGMFGIVIRDMEITPTLFNNYFAGDALKIKADGKTMGIKEWMRQNGIEPFGIPKSLVMSYENLQEQEIVKFLACEAEPAGNVCGNDLNRWCKENFAQYDIASAYASDRCLLEIRRDREGDHLDQGAIEVFFLELLMMQEAAISRVSDRVYDLFRQGAFRETGQKIQGELYDLNLEAANAILFVNYKKLKYPVTRISAKHIGERFGVAEELEHYQGCRAMLEQMIAINTAAEEKTDGDLMNLLLLFLTMLQMVPLMTGLVKYFINGEFAGGDLVSSAGGVLICIGLYGVYRLASRRALKRQRILRGGDYGGN